MAFENIDELISFFSSNNVRDIYFKFLSPNDNAKNQLYFGSDFSALQIFKNLKLNIVPDNEKKQILKASLEFYWISKDKEFYLAPGAQVIFYPQYPEVRMSGFLKGCKNPPSDLMNSRIPDRVFIFGVNQQGHVLATVLSPKNPLKVLLEPFRQSLINQILAPSVFDNKSKLTRELNRIYKLGWINASRLDPSGTLIPCKGSNCGGNTLEAMLGIKSNGRSEPDFLGWEVKQFAVTNFESLRGNAITLFTPEPDSGIYKDHSPKHFIQTFGYKDKSGKNRINFSSPHKFNVLNENTGLTLRLEGFNATTKKIVDVEGGIVLRDRKNKIAAKWDFRALMEHWNTKHNLAVYVPSLKQAEKDSVVQYRYCNRVFLGEKTDFSLFLIACSESKIYYDPGMKLELDTNKTKLRSQFRVNFSNISSLYRKWTETVT